MLSEDPEPHAAASNTHHQLQQGAVQGGGHGGRHGVGVSKDGTGIWDALSEKKEKEDAVSSDDDMFRSVPPPSQCVPSVGSCVMAWKGGAGIWLVL